MFGDSVFSQVPIFKCKQADIEYTYNKVSKNNCLQKSPGGEGGGVISGPWTISAVFAF